MNIKALIEKRNALIAESEDIVASAVDGSLSAEQTERIDAIYNEVNSMTKAIDQLKEMNPMTIEEAKADIQTRTYVDDCKVFASFLKDPKNATQMTQGDNGTVIPETIVNKIISKIETLSDIYAEATKYVAKGTIKIPVVSVGTDDVTVAFCAEGSTPDSHTNKFTAVSLGGELYRAIVQISKKFINNSDLAVVDFVVNRIAEKAASFIENVIFNGYIDTSTDPDTVVIKGIMNSYDSTNMLVNVTGTLALSDLVALKNKIPQAYRSGARFYMRTAVKTTLEQMEDTNHRPLLQPDPTNAYSDRLFGLPVKESDKVPADTIVMAVPNGVAVKEPRSKEIVVDESVYRPSGMVGVFLFGEIDTCVENQQKVAVLTF